MIYRYRFIPLILSAFFEFICFGKLTGTSLPYQDPTIEMLEEQILQSKIWGVLSIIGFIAIVVSIIAIIKNKK